MTADAAVSGAARTERLDLRPPVASDLDELYAICSDARVWGHFPSLRHTDPERTRAMLERWMDGWREHGLDTWVVRPHGEERIIGYGGAGVLGGLVWNLGYRLAADEHGRGYATELAASGLRRANEVAPDLPVIAYLLEHNVASDRVARKVGLELAWRGPDAGNPDPAAIRLVYADRPLTEEQLAAARR
ncbi:GNAT family N-acetyltransferase [Agromyces sp. LHK192]|uniref:GNAT family N-acetyltransferase n=1 Tax=Agromyces sp. LHK192 TaxID=2498704 RepID=UPI000FDA0989|nr:GNAT family N-acetyltransferase [Agromyces sp. LHK192]